MKLTCSVLGLAALTLVLAVAVAMAPNSNSSAASRHDVPLKLTAVVDIEYVLRHDVRLEHRLTGLLSETEVFAEQIAQEKAAIEEKRMALDSHVVGTPEYQRMAMEIAREEETLRAAAEAKQRLFRREESDMYADAYREIQQAVRKFSHEQGISLVLAYDHEPESGDTPEEVERAIRQSPVVHQECLDITESILTAINVGLTEEEKAAAKRPSVFVRPMGELRATGLRFPFHRTLEPFLMNYQR